jgi:hypothetical protein
MRLRISYLSLLLAFTLSCGSSTPRTLVSVKATPATADAINFPNGQVQFVATGTYNRPPSPVTPQPVTAWQLTPNTLATITQNGLAQCISGQTGTASIQVAVAGDGPLMTVAQLTCPCSSARWC